LNHIWHFATLSENEIISVDALQSLQDYTLGLQTLTYTPWTTVYGLQLWTTE